MISIFGKQYDFFKGTISFHLNYDTHTNTHTHTHTHTHTES